MKSLIRKFIKNEVSENEIELLQEYFKTPMGLKHLDEIMNEYASDFDKAHLTQSSHDPLKTITPKNKNVSFLYTVGMIRAIAATFIWIAILAGLYFYISQSHSLTVYKTVAGQKTTITLPDGTIVTLNGNSSLSYRKNWKDKKVRAVTLSGEAYFKVTFNPKKPFVVNTSGILIKVLGTTFNVKSYDDDEAVETTLVEGKVLIEKETAEPAGAEIIELLPHQKAIFSKNSKRIILEKVKVEREAAWVKGSLIFEDESFSDIIKDLERWYGVKITLKDKASLECRFNTRIEKESLEEVLNLFSSNGHVTYHILDDHQVLIEGSLCDIKAD